MSEFFYVSLTARSYGDEDLGLKPHIKGLRSLGSNTWPLGDKRAALHYTTEAPFPNISYCSISNKRAADLEDPRLAEALLMSTYNIFFRGEIRKISCGYPLLSVAMVCGLDKTEIVLTGPFNSSPNQNYVGTKFSCLKYELQYTFAEPDKTYTTTMYVRPAKTQINLCIDPLYKASFLDSPESKDGAYCTISERSDQNMLLQSLCLSRFGQPGYQGKYDQQMLLSECAVAQTDPRLRSSHKTFC